MKILVLSDAHANIWALQAIMKEEKYYDKLAFAGDMVDYGTAPSKVIKWFQKADHAYIVQGNHDQHAVNVAREMKTVCVPDKQYKWIHFNLDQMSKADVDYLMALPQTLYFIADGWAYLMQHQYKWGSYDTIESRSQFIEFWKANTPQSYWEIPRKRVIFGHSHRQCIHVLDEFMEWINPGSISYRRPDDPEKNAQYMVIENGTVVMKRVRYDRHYLYEEAIQQWREGRMMETEIQDFLFFFGNAANIREPLPLRNEAP